jgi:hypothetical protein
MRFKSTRALLVLVAVCAMSAITATSAFASGKPLAATHLASAVGEKGATLNGAVDPEGEATEYYFEYGTTTSYGSKTAVASAGSGEWVDESKTISGLTANTYYYFRIVATNASGTGDGGTKALRTAGGTRPEFKPVPAKKKFTIANLPKSALSFGGGGILFQAISCTTASATGEITGARTVGGVSLVFTGCTGDGNGGDGCPTRSVGAKEGEIVTKPLSGELGTVATKEATSGVGLLFTPTEKTKWFKLEGTRCNLEGTISGSLAAEVAVIGKKQTTNTLGFARATSEGEKIKEITLDSGIVYPPEFESFGTDANLENTDGITFEEALEVT